MRDLRGEGDPMMAGYGTGSLVTGFLFMAVLLVVPFWRLLPRYGIATPFALLAVLPIGALVLLWVIAFRDALDGPRR